MNKKETKTLKCNLSLCSLSKPKVRPCVVISSNKTTKTFGILVLSTKQGKRNQRQTITTMSKTHSHHNFSYFNYPLKIVDSSNHISNDFIGKAWKYKKVYVSKKNIEKIFYSRPLEEQIYIIAKPRKTSAKKWSKAFEESAKSCFITSKNPSYIKQTKAKITIKYEKHLDAVDKTNKYSYLC